MADITIVLMGFINQFITKGHHIVVGFGWDDWNAWDELMSTGHWMFNYVNTDLDAWSYSNKLLPLCMGYNFNIRHRLYRFVEALQLVITT